MLAVPESALAAAMGWADWPARLQCLAPGPLVGTREVWLDGGHNPSAARQIAAFARREFHDGKPLHLIFASLATKDPRGILAPFKASPRTVHTVPIPDHACFAPERPCRDRRRARHPAPTPTTTWRTALGAIPDGARVLIFGSLYLAGAVLAPTNRCPTRTWPLRLCRPSARWRRCILARPRALRGTRHHSRSTNTTASRPAAAVQRNTSG